MAVKYARGIVTALAVGFVGPALAADLPMAKPSMLSPIPMAEAFNWSGLYGNAYVGYNSTTTTATEISNVPDNAANCASAAQAAAAGAAAGQYWCNVNGAPHFTSTPTLSYNQVGNSWSQTTSGFTGGFGVSYLTQAPRSHLVLGAEADFNYLGNSGISGHAPTTDDTTMGVQANSFGTARLVAGYAWDRFLAYSTAGVAFGNFGAWVQDQDTPVGIRTTPTATQWGFAVGGGAAYALTDHWIVKGEYMLLDFPSAGGKTTGYGNLTCLPSTDANFDAGVCAPGGAGNWKTNPLSNPSTGSESWKMGQLMNLMRLGVGYKF